MAQTAPEIVRQFLANTTNPMIVKSLVAEDATYVSLNYDNPDLKKIMPWTGTGKGPQAFVDTFARVSQFWQILAFSVEELFGVGENVAVFGRFTYKSTTQGKTVESPFSILSRVHDGKIVYFNSWRTPSRRLPASNPAELQGSIATRTEKKSRSSTDAELKGQEA